MKMSTRKTIIINGEKITAPIGLLNTIGIWASEASERFRERGAHGLDSAAARASDEIYEQLMELGVYND